MKTYWGRYPSRSKPDKQGKQPDFTYALGHPVMFHWPVLALIALLLLIGAALHIPLMVVVAVFVLILSGVSWLWSRYSLENLAFKLSTGKSRAFPDETVELTLEVGNNKILFLPWLHVEVELPLRLTTGRLRLPSRYLRERLAWTTSISAGQRLVWKESIKCKARGEYELGPARLRSGDIFGFFPRETVLPASQTLLVYPRIVSLDKLNLPLKELVGLKQAPRNFYGDISRTIGSRDYQPDDPFKHIHWKASVRVGRLQTRQFESTTSLRLFVIFDVYSFCHGVDNEELFELAASTIASLANEACRQEFALGLTANSAPPIELPIATGASQLLAILEALARVEAKSLQPLIPYLNQRRSGLPESATLTVITADLSTSLISLAEELEQVGHSLVIVDVGRKSPVRSVGAIPIVSIAPTATKDGGESRKVSP